LNFNKRLKCVTCKGLIDCRIGMSNRDVQPFRFCCPACGEVIEFTLTQGVGFEFKNAEDQNFKGPFDGTYPFVDLHIDFPVSFGDYKMGYTPFMKAISRIGHKNFSFHNQRLNYLNDIYPLYSDLSRIIRLYSKNKQLFSTLCSSKFHVDVISNKQQDINAALYMVIAKVFFPFSMPQDNAQAVDRNMNIITSLAKRNEISFSSFIKEIITSGFLKNLQKSCLEIYPRILDAELPLRSALFLDFDDDYEAELVPFRISVEDFKKYKDLYKDISEILSRELILIAGINNLDKRGDFDKFNDEGKFTPKHLNGFADIPFGTKLNYLDNNWYELSDSSIDNKLRNAIAHYKVDYNEITQIITYYPRKEGIKQDKKECIYFLDFMRKILISYREMHRIHHLIKALEYYHLLIYKDDSTK